MYKFISQTLDGFKEIRILGKENFFFNQIKENTRIWTDAFKKIFLISTMIKYFVEYIFVFIVVIFTIIIYFTGKDLNQYLPLLAIFIVAGIRLFPVTNSILNNIVQIRTGKDTIRRLYDVIEKIPNSTWNNKKNLNSDMDTNNSFKAINLDNISFKYHEQKDLIFQETSLTIKSGSIIGFIGESGSGKSTLIDIIVGLIEPIAIQIKINNLKLNENLYL